MEPKCISLFNQILSFKFLFYLPLLSLTGHEDAERFEPSTNTYQVSQVSLFCHYHYLLNTLNLFQGITTSAFMASIFIAGTEIGNCTS